MRELYMCTHETAKKHESSFAISEIKPRLFKAYPKQKITPKILMHNMYWWLLTRGKYRIWCAYDGDNVIHTSYVIPKCKKFPFLNNDSYEIGPCYTESKYRGNGIYPAAIYQIVENGGGVLLT